MIRSDVRILPKEYRKGKRQYRLTIFYFFTGWITTVLLFVYFKPNEKVPYSHPLSSLAITCFYTVATDHDFQEALPTLLSIRLQSPLARLFVISRILCEENKQILQSNHIAVIELDLLHSNLSRWSKSLTYFYISTAPLLLFERGFMYSVYVSHYSRCISDPFPIQTSSITLMHDNIDLFATFQTPVDVLHSATAIYFNNSYLQSQKMDVLSLIISNPPLRYPYPQIIPRLVALWFNNLTIAELIDSGILVQNDRKFMLCRNNNSMHNLCQIYSQRRMQLFYLYSIFSGASQRVKSVFKSLSFALRGLRYSARVRERNSRITLRVFWFKTTGLENFGDELSRYLIPFLFGYSVQYASIDESEVMAIGSILGWKNNCTNPVIVWGSGFMYPESIRSLPNATICALRGPLSASSLSLNAIPLGDPGLLVSVMFEKDGHHYSRIGVVVHYIDLDLPIIDKIRKDKRVIVINPLDPPDVVCKEISKCHCILSSSLHGMIVADSYRIPNCRIKFSKLVAGDEYKFRDYCYGVGRIYSHIDLSAYTYEVSVKLSDILPDELIKKCLSKYRPIRTLRLQQRTLVQSFPSWGTIKQIRNKTAVDRCK